MRQSIKYLLLGLVLFVMGCQGSADEPVVQEVQTAEPVVQEVQTAEPVVQEVQTASPSNAEEIINVVACLLYTSDAADE